MGVQHRGHRQTADEEDALSGCSTDDEDEPPAWDSEEGAWLGGDDEEPGETQESDADADANAASTDDAAPWGSADAN